MAEESAAKGTVNLFGSRVKKGYVIAGGLVVGSAVIYGWYKNKQAAADTTSDTTTADTTTAGDYSDSGDSYPSDGSVGDPSDPDSIDPTSGMTYGDEGAFSSGYGALDTYGDTYGYGGYYSGTSSGETAYETNGQWAQSAEDYLVNSVGADATTVAAALGKYVTGQAVTADQMDVIEQAIAFVGYPPVNGTDGYPPNIRQTPTTTTTTSGGTVTVPNVVGQEVWEAEQALSAVGLKGSGPAAVSGQTHIVTATSPAAGTSVATGSTVTLSYKTTSATSTPPATTSGGGTTKAKVPATPKNVKVSGAGPTGFGISWSPSAGATQYSVRITYQDKLAIPQKNLSGTVLGVSGLKPNRTYTVHVKAGSPAGWSAETNGPQGKTTKG